MVSVTDALKKAATDQSCLVRRCKEAGCSVSLKGLPNPHEVMSLERPGAPIDQREPHCDYLIAYSDQTTQDRLVALELKKTIKDVGELVDQLQGGASAAESLLSGVPNIKFVPVVAGKAHPHEYRVLRQKSVNVKFRGKEWLVQRIRCGDTLMQALECVRRRQRRAEG